MVNERVTTDTFHSRFGTNLPSNSIKVDGHELRQIFLTDQISVLKLNKVHVQHNKSKVSVPKIVSSMSFTEHVLVLLDLEETISEHRLINYYKEFYYHLSNAKQQKKIKNFTIISSRSYGSFDDDIYDTFKHLDNFMSLYWFLCTYSVNYPNTISRNKDSNKVLFLPGKLWRRPQRAPILYTILARPEYTSRCNYSYTVDQSDWWEEASEELFWEDMYTYVTSYNADYTPTLDEIKKLFIENEHDIDGLQSVNVKLKQHMMYPVSEEVYNTSSVELVTETWWPQSYHHLTEKTFRPLLAGQVFVHLNSMHTKLLHKLGFQTFVDLGDAKWRSEEWQNIDAKTYCSSDNDLKVKDINNNLHRAFNIADCVSDKSYDIDSIISHNRSLCDQYLKEYSDTLNSAHDDLFTPEVINNLYSINGAW